MNYLLLLPKIFILLSGLVSVSITIENHAYVYIQNPHSGLVFDVKSTVLTVEKYSGADSQLWKLESIPSGTFYIQNKLTGDVLDTIGGELVVPNNLTTYHKTGSATQQWYMDYDGELINMATRAAIDIRWEEYREGNFASLWLVVRGALNQQWRAHVADQK